MPGMSGPRAITSNQTTLMDSVASKPYCERFLSERSPKPLVGTSLIVPSPGTPSDDAPFGHPVDFGDLRRTRPLSAQWGFDRGLPIDRYYIEGFLSANAADVGGCVL